MPASNPFDFNNWLQNDGDNLPPASTSVYGRGDFHGIHGVERYLPGSTLDLSVVAPTHPTPQPDVAVLGADEDSGTVQAPAIPGLDEIIAKLLGKSMWMPVAILFLALVVVAHAARNSGTTVAGLSVGELVSIELILFMSGLMSGLFGFGFSAVGAGCLLFIGPITEALLILYSIYSMFKLAGAKIRGFDGPVTGAIVGFIGGAIGGFTASPSAAVVAWTSLRDLPKAQNRAIVEPYIIMSHIFSLILIALLHSNYLSYHYWMLLLITLPAVLPGTAIGVMIYRRISDVNFKRVSYLLLGLSGVALLLKVYGPILARLF